MRTRYWDLNDGELSEEVLRRRFPPEAFRLSRRVYPPGSAFIGRTRACTLFVLSGSCWLRSVEEGTFSSGAVVELDEGPYELRVSGTREVETVTVWDLRAHGTFEPRARGDLVGPEREFRKFLAEYIGLQEALLTLLGRSVDLERREFFNDLPVGHVNHDGSIWSYRGHGRGVTLEHDGKLVNAHIAAFAPDAVDAWRLSVYAESCGMHALSYEGRTFEADEANIRQRLDHLAANGELVAQRVAPTHTVYRSSRRQP